MARGWEDPYDPGTGPGARNPTPTSPRTATVPDTSTGSEAGPEFYISGTSGSSQQSTGYTPIAPPILEILTAMAQRRQANRETAALIAQTLASLAGKAAPAGLGNIPGFESGGVYDMMGGIMSGKGKEAFAKTVPEAFRNPGKIKIPISRMDIREPSIEEEFGSAESLAKRILDAIKIVQTSQSSGSSGSTSYNQISESSSSDTSSLLSDLASAFLGSGGNPTGGSSPSGAAFGPDGQLYLSESAVKDPEMFKKFLEEIGISWEDIIPSGSGSPSPSPSPTPTPNPSFKPPYRPN